ncbi:DUF2076 domain-containing protein [Halothiobacillus sp.]|uniref:DUF2076 domain-containing protein n=1 Tax=Halothiobacillus sp. TaxID=1891311 RepID=UPI0026227B4C|nr:DUF2076 domain-containing protein [Halothiobacillus sp.]
MNYQERTLLNNLLNNLREAAQGMTSSAQDPEAAQMIRDTFTAAPDAAYLLVQRHLLLEMALEQAQAQIKALQSQASGSFLGGTTPQSIPNNPVQTNAYGQPIGRAEPSPLPAAASAANSAVPSARPAFGGGSFLGTAAATATGVLGGALLFQGIEHLMGGGLGGGALAGNQPVEDVTNITENFYETSPGTDMSTSGWDNSTSPFDNPAADPIDPMQADSSGMFDQGDSGSGFFDGLLGDSDDEWV